MSPVDAVEYVSKIGVRILFFQAEDGIRDYKVTGVQTCALPICAGDLVTVNIPGQGNTNFTFQTDPAQGALNGDAGVAFGTIGAALTAAGNVAGTDSIDRKSAV